MPLVIGATGRKRNRENEIEGFARPNREGGEPEYKAFNMNQITTEYEIRGILSDEIADKLNSSENFADKHEALDRLDTLFESADLLKLEIRDLDADRVTTDETGFIKTEEDDERPEDGNVKFDVTLGFLAATKQGS